MACIPCAIEMEPKTLNPGQINHARKLAEVFQKIEPEGPRDLLIQELEGAHSLEALEQITEESEGESLPEEIVDQIAEINSNQKEISQNCLCAKVFNINESPNETGQKEPLTAPF